MRRSTSKIHFLIQLLQFLVIVQLLDSTEGRPHHDDNTYTPVIRFLKELRKARKLARVSGTSSASALLPIKDGESGGNQGGDNAGGSSSNYDSSIRVGVGGGSSSNNNNKDLTNLQLEQTLQQISAQLPTQPPYPIERVNRGLQTLLGGVNSGSLADILRGSFTFTRNENVRSVANTVIDSIFGKTPSVANN